MLLPILCIAFKSVEAITITTTPEAEPKGNKWLAKCAALEDTEFYKPIYAGIKKTQEAVQWKPGEKIVSRNNCTTFFETESLMKGCLHVQLYNNQIYVVGHVPDGTRGMSIALRLKQLLDRVEAAEVTLPNVELFFALFDATDSYSFWSNAGYTVPWFTPTYSGEGVMNIPFPAYNFMAEPESFCEVAPHISRGKKRTYGSFVEQQRMMCKSNSEYMTKWEDKIDQLYFIGRPFGARPKAFENIKKTIQGHGIKLKSAAPEEAGACQMYIDSCNSRYLLNINGVRGYSFGLKKKFLCGSTVISNMEFEFKGKDIVELEFYYHMLKPGKHFVSVDDPQFTNINASLSAIDDQKAQEIAKNGHDFACDILSPQNIDCYFMEMIRKASVVLPTVVEVDLKAIPLESFIIARAPIHPFKPPQKGRFDVTSMRPANYDPAWEDTTWPHTIERTAKISRTYYHVTGEKDPEAA